MEIFQVSKEKSGFDSKRFTTGLVLCLVLLSASIMILTTNRNSTFALIGVFDGDSQNSSASRYGKQIHFPDGEVLYRISDSRIVEGPDSRNIPSDNNVHDRIFSPLLDKQSCLSRYESVRYRRPSLHKPSPYLLTKLQEYEDLHKQCGPYSESYNRSITGLKSGNTSSSTSCKYIIWIPANGLGNRIISMASTFLYALLSNRVLLLDHGKDMDNLFCEPFPDTSWLLSKTFPLRNHWKKRYAHGFATILKTSTTIMSPSHMYLNLDHSEYLLDKKLFYCDKTEAFLGNVTWLMMLSDQHFAPYFFLSRTYRIEVSKMFPGQGGSKGWPPS